MKLYSHKIAKSKLVKLRLNEEQIQRVYAHKTKTSQLLYAKRFASANKASRAKKFYKSALAMYVTKKQINKLAMYAKTSEFKQLAKKQQTVLEKKYFKLTIKLTKIQEARAKTIQQKQDIREYRQYKLDMLRGRIASGEKRYFINRPTQESYEYNGTLNVTSVQYVVNHHGQEIDELMNDEDNPMTFQQAVDYLFEEAVRNGELKALAQGAGYGYIDEENKEVISPI